MIIQDTVYDKIDIINNPSHCVCSCHLKMFYKHILPVVRGRTSSRVDGQDGRKVDLKRWNRLRFGSLLSFWRLRGTNRMRICKCEWRGIIRDSSNTNQNCPFCMTRQPSYCHTSELSYCCIWYHGLCYTVCTTDTVSVLQIYTMIHKLWFIVQIHMNKPSKSFFA